MITDSRAYLNSFMVWGARTYDPANTDNIKSVRKEFRKTVVRNKVMPRRPNSRFLSTLSSTYQT